MDNSPDLLRSMCRTCMSSKDIMKQNLYEKLTADSCEGLSIAELLQSVLQIDGLEDDDLPKIICENCISQLISTHYFLQMCKDSEQKYRKLLREDIHSNQLEEVLIESHADIIETEESKVKIDNEAGFGENEPCPEFEAVFLGNKSDEDSCDEDNPFDKDDSDDSSSMDTSKRKKCKFTPQEQSQRTQETNSKPTPILNEDGSITCKECQQVVPNESIWLEHVLVHISGKIIRKKGRKKNPETYICEYCGKVFDKRKNYKHHEVSHIGKQPPKPKINQRKENAIRRMRGEQYFGYTMADGCRDQYVPKPQRAMGPTCESRFCIRSKERNCPQFDEASRKHVFDTFWNMTWEEKKIFVREHVIQTNTKYAKVKNSRRHHSCFFNLPYEKEKLKVCKSMFLSTLSVHENMVRGWLNCRGRGRNRASPIQTIEDIKIEENCN